MGKILLNSTNRPPGGRGSEYIDVFTALDFGTIGTFDGEQRRELEYKKYVLHENIVVTTPFFVPEFFGADALADGLVFSSATADSVLIYNDLVSFSISSVADSPANPGVEIRVTTSTAHGFTQERFAALSGTTTYDGTFQITRVPTTTTFDVAGTFVATSTGTATGSNGIPLFYGRDTGAVILSNMLVAGVTPDATSGQLFDLEGKDGVTSNLVILDFVGVSNFERLGRVINLGCAMATSNIGVYRQGFVWKTHLLFPFVTQNTLLISTTVPAQTPAFSFTGPGGGLLSTSQTSLNSFYPVPDSQIALFNFPNDAVAKSINIAGIGYTASNPFFRAEVSIAISGVVDAGGGDIFIDTSTDIPYVENDIVIITNTTSYNGTFTVLERVHNQRFRITDTFVATETGDAIADCLDEKDSGVNVAIAGDQPSSARIAAGIMNGNATVDTTITNPNEYVSLDLGLNFFKSPISQRSTLTAASRARFSYDDPRPVNMTVGATGQIVKSGSTAIYRIAVVKNTETALFTTSITSVSNVGGNASFNHAGADPAIGQIVVIKGYTAGAISYNGIRTVSASSAGAFELENVAFAIDQATGEFESPYSSVEVKTTNVLFAFEQTIPVVQTDEYELQIAGEGTASDPRIFEIQFGSFAR